MTRPSRRPAFTLVEVLVVISIILVIMAIAVGSYFAIQAGQTKSASEATVGKIDGLLLRKLKMIRDGIEDDAKSGRAGTGIKELTDLGYKPEVAKGILMYCRTKNQLPMSFKEAVTGFLIPGTAITVPRHASFASIPAASLLLNEPEEAANCLYLALATLDPAGTEQQIGVTPTNNYKCFKDAFGKPLLFHRLAYGGDGSELDNDPYVKGQVYDPYFTGNTNGVPQDLAANNNLGAGGVATVWTTVWQNVPLWATTGMPTAAYPGKRNHTACVISSGGNETYGTGADLFRNGNIVSYRLRKEGAKGD